jgi:hypothetical protein
MSLWRSVYYCAVIAGWAAFFGWLPAEFMFFHSGTGSGNLAVTVTGAMLGAAVGLGLGLVAGMANARLKQLILRGLVGLAGGAACGAVGATLGNVLFTFGIPRAFGWLVMGLGIGVVDGVYEKSKSKIRNGLIGGCIGGLMGGFLFDPLQSLIASQSGMTSRAVGFVILGLCIGALIGLAQVVLKDAWLTVLDGYRAGRQLILSQNVTALGRGDHLALPFMGPMNKDLESEHLRIIRQANGSYLVEDNHSKLGTRLNNQPVQSPSALKDGDVIKFGTNFVRFNERRRSAGNAPPVMVPAAHSQQITGAPPPPPIKRPAGSIPPPKPTIVKTPTPNGAPPQAPAKPPLPPPVPVAKQPAAAAKPLVVKRPESSLAPPPPPHRK